MVGYLLILTVQVQSLQKEMDSLQETARQQLVALAAQGENAVAIAQDQLVKAHNMIEELTLLIKVGAGRFDLP